MGAREHVNEEVKSGGKGQGSTHPSFLESAFLRGRRRGICYGWPSITSVMDGPSMSSASLVLASQI